MKKHVLLLGVGVSSFTAILLAQSLPTTVPSKPHLLFAGVQSFEDARRVFTIQGKEYVSFLRLSAAESAKAWDPSLPIPISLEHAEEAARLELRKLADDEILWRFSELSIARLTGKNAYVWYFAVTLKPVTAPGEKRSDSFTLVMDSNGKPGGIGRLGP